MAGGDAVCDLNSSNVPVIGTDATFVGFTMYNKPINGVVSVDGDAKVTVTDFTFPGSNGRWPSDTGRQWIITTPGDHVVHGSFTWPHQGDENGSFTASVTCPKPTPPPVPTPTPTPQPAPKPHIVPPPVQPVPPPHKFTPQPRPRAHVVRRAAVIDYYNPDPPAHAAKVGAQVSITVRHPGLLHGLQTFRRHVSGGRNVGRCQWRVGQSLKVHKGRLVGGHRVRAQHPGVGVFAWAPGPVLRAYLFNTKVFDRPNIQGHYDVGVSCRIREPARAHSSRSSWT